MNLNQILPLVLTCPAAPETTGLFADSYATRLKNELPPPAVVVHHRVDTLDGAYWGYINRLGPRMVRMHNASEPLSPLGAAWSALRLAAALQDPWVLFLEDDTEFSSRFVDQLSCLKLPNTIGFYTLYQPGHGHGLTIVPDRFYGTQAALMPLESVHLLLRNRAEGEEVLGWWDMKWAAILGRADRPLLGSDGSYVQHLPRKSRIGSPSHRSEVFIK